MKEIKDTLGNLCREFDEDKSTDGRFEKLGMMERIADISIRLDEQDRLDKKTDLDHEEADRKIDATFKIQESEEIRKDRIQELEEEKVRVEDDANKRRYTAEEKEAIAKAAIATVGAIGTGAVTIVGLKHQANLFKNLKEWDDTDVIPTSITWDTFRKMFLK